MQRIGIRRRDRQPSATRLRLASELAGGVVYSPHLGGLVEATSGATVTYNAGASPQVTVRVTDQGYAYTFSTEGNEQGVFLTAPAYNNSLPGTSIIAIVRSVASYNNQIVAAKVYDGSVEPFNLCIDDVGSYGGMSAYSGATGWVKSGITTSILNDQKWHVVGGTIKAGGNLRYFVDGRLDSSASGAPAAPSNSNDLGLGARAGQGAHFGGDIVLGIIVPYEIHEGFMRAVTVSPRDTWALAFAPSRQRVAYFLSTVAAANENFYIDPLMFGAGL